MTDSRRSSLATIVGAVGNVVIVLALLWLGVRYDDQQRTPGTLIWVAVLLVLPAWMRELLLPRRADPPPELRMAQELHELSRRRRITDVVVQLERELPATRADADITESNTDDQRR